MASNAPRSGDKNGDKPGRRPLLHRWPINADLGALRARLQPVAIAAGLSATRVADLLIAVNEAVDNVLQHADGRGAVTVWHDTRTLTVDVLDRRGHLNAGHLPHRPPAPTQTHGYGLWIIRQVCDELTIHRRPGRSRIRLRMLLHAPPVRS